MDREQEFGRYVNTLAQTLGHADRVGPLGDYCRGLMLSGERKSVEPMAALVAPRAVSAKHQSLHHFIAKADWNDAALLSAVRREVLPGIGAIEAWIVDDTGYPKKGKHSVGVARQYCGQLGKQDNCQVAVSVSVANEKASLPIDYQLYLPREWAEDLQRRRKTEVPTAVCFKTKTAIALEQLQRARARQVAAGVVLADAGYGNDAEFRDGISALGLTYAVGIQGSTTVWAQDHQPLPPRRNKGRGRPGVHLRRDAKHRPIDVKALAHELPARAWRRVQWREGTGGALASRFARVRARAAHRDEVRAEEWLVIEWPLGETEPAKYWLSSLPEAIAFKQLVRLIKLRWRIERDYQELKQELGLGHYEGRNWCGFHHHASLTIAAYGFLMRSRLQGRGKKNSTLRAVDAPLRAPAQPKTFIPRGSPRAA
ncbi:MAG: IS701 family transposase [Burkholderiales bacterium]|nr:IS701 family transposase [Burkholderiales bacterium]